MLLAGDNIKLELPGGKSIIEGKENLKLSLESWFLETNDIQIQQSWGMPIKFINAEGELMSGDWIITGHTLKSSRNEVTSFEDNHINVLIDGGKVQYLKVFNHSLVEPVNVVVSVDLSNAKDKFESVSILGTFNDWCNSCDFMTDEDNDGVAVDQNKFVKLKHGNLNTFACKPTELIDIVIKDYNYFTQQM